MKVSLSVRVAEAARRKDVSTVPFDALAAMAADAGFEALSMRASVVAVDSPEAQVLDVRGTLARHGLAVSLVTGDVALAANSAGATAALHDIGRYLDLAEALGAPLVRVMAHGPDDVARLRAAAEEAARRGLTIAHQTHWGTLCETVDDTLDVAHAVGHAHFGITLDPANLRACGSEPDGAAVARLAPHLANVFFQNVVLDPSSPIAFPSRRRGAVGIRYVALDDRAGIDLDLLLSSLANVGYDDWFTLHQPLRDGQTVADAIAEAGAVRACIEARCAADGSARARAAPGEAGRRASWRRR